MLPSGRATAAVARHPISLLFSAEYPISIRFMIIDEQAAFRSLLMHHVTTRWPDAILSAYDPTAAGHLPDEFSGAGNDVILLGDRHGDDRAAELLTQQDRRHLSTNSDSEVLLNVFAHELQTRVNGQPTPENIFDAVDAVHKRCTGGYAVVALIVGFGIVAFRDPNGIRPLVLGERELRGHKDYIVASESVALDVLQFSRLRDVQSRRVCFYRKQRHAALASVSRRSQAYALYFRVRVLRPSRFHSR